MECMWRNGSGTPAKRRRQCDGIQIMERSLRGAVAGIFTDRPLSHEGVSDRPPQLLTSPHLAF